MRRPETPETVKRRKPKILVLLLTWAITGTGTAAGSNLDDTEVVPGLKARAAVGDVSHHRYLGSILDQMHIVTSATGRIFKFRQRKGACRIGRHFDDQLITVIITRAEIFNRGEIIISRLQ